MQGKAYQVLVTDLDNTLFDWVDIWYRAFNAMLQELLTVSGVEQELLLDQIREVHQARGTSEYALLIEEVPILGAPTPDEVRRKYDAAISAYTDARKEAQVLYPGVAETLIRLKEIGVRIIGYTESMEFYALRRVREMKLDGLIDVVYTSPDHRMPKGITPSSLRTRPQGHYELLETVHRRTPEGELKPNPVLLLDIIKDAGATPDQCVYLGDSLIKDVLMAQRAGVQDAYAKYGKAQHREEYELLRRVTHWTDEDVKREKELQEQDASPSVTLYKGFHELLEKFAFAAFDAARK